VSPAVLTPVADKAGKKIPGVLHAGKSGYLYVHDAKDCSVIRSTGLVEAKNERALPTKEGVVIRPGLNGGVSATPLAIDPKLGLAYALTNESALKYYFFTSTEYPNGKLAGATACFLTRSTGKSIRGIFVDNITLVLIKYYYRELKSATVGSSPNSRWDI